jgi:hypothetical protein
MAKEEIITGAEIDLARDFFYKKIISKLPSIIFGKTDTETTCIFEPDEDVIIFKDNDGKLNEAFQGKVKGFTYIGPKNGYFGVIVEHSPSSKMITPTYYPYQMILYPMFIKNDSEYVGSLIPPKDNLLIFSFKKKEETTEI